MTACARFAVAAVFAGMLSATGTIAHGQSELRIPAGQTVTVTETKILVDQWVMEDNSTLVVAPGIRTWTIHALKASFGSNTRIVAIGRDGADGANSRAHGGHGAECKDGKHGGRGEHGKPGGSGPNLDITMGLVSVTDLLIEASGGKGGNGGKGANGGNGGGASCSGGCSGQEGGNGGRGGNAGRGGNGGDVTISYWLSGSDADVRGGERGPGLRVSASGGEPGTPGDGGSRGAGGAGTRCLGGLYRHGGGAWGGNGRRGESRGQGRAGLVKYFVIPNPE